MAERVRWRLIWRRTTTSTVVTNPDGSKRPGTPNRRKLGAGGIAVVVTIPLVVATGTAELGGLGASADVTASTSIRTARTSGQKAERSRLRLQVRPRIDGNARIVDDEQTEDCAAAATGAVRQYLVAHPCRSLQRAVLRVGTSGGQVVVAIAWIEMPDTARAAELKSVVDTYGTGEIKPLDPDVQLTGQHYASRRVGDLVTVAEAEPVVGPLPTEILDGLADQASS